MGGKKPTLEVVVRACSLGLHHLSFSAKDETELAK